MIDFLRSIIKPDVAPLNYIKIHKDNILDNFKTLQSFQNQAEIWPVLKSNAYGHGIKEVSKILKNTTGKYICVDSFPEYQVVKKYSGKKVLVLWETRSENYKFFDFKQTTFCVYNIETLQYLISLNKNVTIHFFINTWMNREWFQEDSLRLACELIKGTKINLEWVCSHFSSADERDFEISEKQIEKFKDLYEIILSYDLNPTYRHLWASWWTIKIYDRFFNAFRPWVALFWINVLVKEDEFYNKAQKLKLCMSIYSTLINIQKIDSWEGISYNHTYIFPNDSKSWVIPFGYFEGFTRKMSNKYSVKIWEKYFSMRWNICMNLSTLEIEYAWVSIGDEVEILSIDEKSKNNIYYFAQASETIAYEVLVKIHPSIRREIV